ncbi:MAG TPA: methyl-accepting chemotaxis protein [Gemmatimonadaceae bacterium]
MSIFSLFSPIRGRQAPSLHRRFIIGAGFGAALAVLLLAAGANMLLGRDAEQQGDTRVADAASRARIVVTQALDDRTRQAKVLALTPEIVGAAREGGARARALGIVGADVAELEKRFDRERSMNVAPATRQFLRDLLPQLEAAEILLTDANGYNAVTTQLSSDFVQSDEAWWQSAWRDGVSSVDVAYDSSAHQITVSLATVVKDGSAKAGVVKLGFSIAPFVQSLSSAGAGVHIDVLDSTDRVLLSSDSANAGHRLQGMPSGGADSAQAVSVAVDSVTERALALRANAGRWRIVAHLPTAEIAAPFRTARLVVLGGAGAVLLVLVLPLAAMNQFLQRRIFIPARELAEAAEAVAAGDFSVQLRRLSADDEIGRLSRAIGAMILELRRLAQAIAGAARETSVMSAEITAGSEEMAATAGEIAHTASDLSAQSTSMAETIASLAVSAGSLRVLAAALDAGARDGVVRNTALRTLALENRAGLDASAESLGSLATDVHASATAITALSDASEEIRSFVTLVRKLARQSRLLALNAAMEAARAGTQGAGFAVVATEVRRLASMSSDAAERTEAIVKSVLRGIDASRESADRAVSTADEVRAATAKASESFSDIEHAVADAEAWTASIEQTAVTTSGLVAEMTQRLDSLASGTEAFAAAMEQVAASSEEQSASTQEIAGAANTLGSAAERLSKLVGGLRVET